MTDTTRDIPDNVRNVLVIMTDQHRTDTIGCLGNPHARTPVIDAMGEIGDALPADLRETGLGGLAGTPTGRKIAREVTQAGL